MSVDIVIPKDLWEEDTEAVITTWLVSDGNSVSKDELVAEVMAEKIQYEVVSPSDGVLSIQSPEDTVVNKGDIIGVVK